jgi:hypothetical protein
MEKSLAKNKSIKPWNDLTLNLLILSKEKLRIKFIT